MKEFFGSFVLLRGNSWRDEGKRKLFHVVVKLYFLISFWFIRKEKQLWKVDFFYFARKKKSLFFVDGLRSRLTGDKAKRSAKHFTSFESASISVWCEITIFEKRRSLSGSNSWIFFFLLIKKKSISYVGALLTILENQRERIIFSLSRTHNRSRSLRWKASGL